MPYGSYSDYIQNKAGQGVSGALVTVYATGTTTKASIYSDAAGTALSNPFPSGSEGLFTFFAADGVYDLSISMSGYATGNVSGAAIVYHNPTTQARTVSDNYEIDASADRILMIDTTSKAITVTLPDISDNSAGVEYIIKNIGATGYAVTITTGDGAQILPASAGTLTLQDEQVGLAHDGTAWRNTR